MENAKIVLSCFNHLGREASVQQVSVATSLSMETLRKFSGEAILDHFCTLSGTDVNTLKQRVQVGLRTSEGNVFCLSLLALNRGVFASLQATFPRGKIIQKEHGHLF